jgi:phage baseplate assembly protein V
MIDAIQRLHQRILHAIGRGRVTTGNDTGSVQTQQIKLGADEIKDDVPRLAEFGFTSMPPVGSDAVLVFIGGDRSNGAIVATGHQASRPKGLKAGEAMIYTQDGKSIYLTADSGIVVDAKGQAVVVNEATNVTINASGKVRMVTPLLEVTGDIIDNVGANQHNMAQMRSIYNGHKHDVSGVAAGTGTVTSKTTTQTE